MKKISKYKNYAFLANIWKNINQNNIALIKKTNEYICKKM